jgi:hypothetical protein
MKLSEAEKKSIRAWYHITAPDGTVCGRGETVAEAWADAEASQGDECSEALGYGCDPVEEYRRDDSGEWVEF